MTEVRTSIQARKLRALREAAGLSHAQMAELLDEDEATLGALETSPSMLDLELVERCARAFGMTVERLLSTDAAKAPAPLLFRSLNRDVISELHAHRAHFALGDFLRTCGDLAELAKLRERKGVVRPSRVVGARKHIPVPEDDPTLYRQAEQLALDVRSWLALGDGPITSMVDVVEHRLNVPIVWTTPDEVDVNIDGASTSAPIPAVLVNLVGGRERWWRTRMTLAHELCHVLFDALPDTDHQMVMFSPHRDGARAVRGRTRSYPLPETLERMERRANAFAAYFLVPGKAIRRLVPRSDATSENAITLLCQQFGIGRITAVNQLHHVWSLSKQERARMLDRAGEQALPHEHPDAEVPGGRAPRCKTLLDWVDDALAHGWISKVRAYDYLGLELSESRAGQPPVLSEAAEVRLRAYAYLGRRDLTVQWRVDEPIEDGERWRAPVFELDADGERRDRGTVVLTRAREILEHETSFALDAS
ncbi:MAG: ImmA/IrrE family metallo-endopeptidase [Myxococcales bacterium]|nr:ImmA/IrrE family metallo-endopeptidase [Myxococcales bacterium]